jgi:uncharacterized membrane protein YphA (DoxX/SURF4 family)
MLARALSLLLALLLLAAGAAKLLRLEMEVSAFERFDLPLYTMVIAGVAELAAAALLVRQATATLGAIIGVGVMCVAVGAHLHAGETPQAALPVAVGAALVFAGWQRRDGLAWLWRA